jgi:hypothetical protein
MCVVSHFACDLVSGIERKANPGSEIVKNSFRAIHSGRYFLSFKNDSEVLMSEKDNPK